VVWRVKKGFEERVAGLNSLIKACARAGKIERASAIDAEVLETIYPELAGWLVVNPFTVEEVMALSPDGIRLPARVTRFVLSQRAR